MGNGVSINIWEDRWLPTPHTYRVITLEVDICETSQVLSLIDPDTRSWHLAKLNQFFLPIDINAIRSIPLGNLQKEDRRVWIGNTTRIFTVKSAYYIALQAHQVGLSNG